MSLHAVLQVWAAHKNFAVLVKTLYVYYGYITFSMSVDMIDILKYSYYKNIM